MQVDNDYIKDFGYRFFLPDFINKLLLSGLETTMELVITCF